MLLLQKFMGIISIDNQLHEKDLVLDNKDLLFFIDKWEKQNETV